MDIRYPLSTLRNMLQKRFNIDLSDYKFWLQDAQMVKLTFGDVTFMN